MEPDTSLAGMKATPNSQFSPKLQSSTSVATTTQLRQHSHRKPPINCTKLVRQAAAYIWLLGSTWCACGIICASHTQTNSKAKKSIFWDDDAKRKGCSTAQHEGSQVCMWRGKGKEQNYISRELWRAIVQKVRNVCGRGWTASYKLHTWKLLQLSASRTTQAIAYRTTIDVFLAILQLH